MKTNCTIQDLKKLKTKLQKVEKELEKVRGCSPLTDGWQTQRYAKKSRKWDVLAKERMLIIQRIEEIDQKDWLMDTDIFR